MKPINDVSEVQKLLKDSLRYLKGVCEKYGLRFFLSNGTLLGAVKYRDFIPWDDDADILMPREDYNRLMSIPEIDNGVYRLLSAERTPNWRLPYAKLSLAGTVLQETTADFGLECGLAVDIFPLDKWDDHRAAAYLQASYCALLRRFVSASVEETFFTPKRGLARGILYLIWLYSRRVGASAHCRQIQKQIAHGAKRAKGAYVGSAAWAAYGWREVMPKGVFEKQIGLPLGGEEYPAPIGYAYYLQRMYGDFWLDPPAERQKSNHVIKLWYKDE